MKKVVVVGIAFLVVCSSLISGCEAAKNTNKTQRGAAIGAIAGGVLGAVIANNVKGGNAALGAAMGAAVGGAAGGVIGHKMDKQAREIQTALPGVDVQRVGEGIHLTLGENAVNFDFNKSTLTPSAKANLDKLQPIFNEYNQTNIKIYGYTDSKGSDEYNLSLSEKRANSVRAYLISKGLVANRFEAVGQGEVDPIADNETEEGRAKNRRVEFTIIANDAMINDAQKEIKE
jgi:outer membrane protein OmpA-like peptidoglycan-associated protein